MSYAPNESASDIFLEQCLLDGVVAGAIVFGMLSMVAFNCFHYLFKDKRLEQVNWAMVIYTFVIYAWATIYVGTWTKLIEMIFIDDSNYPGGPLQYFFNVTPTIYDVTDVSYAVINLMADGLLVYRCWMVWNRRWVVIIIPLLMYLADIAMAILGTFQQINPIAPFFANNPSLSFQVPYFSISVALTILLSIMIAARLLSARKRIVDVLGPQHAKLYTSITAMIVESAGLFTLSSIFVISSFGVGLTVGLSSNYYLLFNVIAPIHTMVTAIAPLLLISRVARGHAYSEEAVSRSVSSIHFRPGTGSLSLGSTLHGSANRNFEEWGKESFRTDPFSSQAV